MDHKDKHLNPKETPISEKPRYLTPLLYSFKIEPESGTLVTLNENTAGGFLS